MQYVCFFILSYLIGSIPFSYLIARYWKGIDIRQVGSGNVGTTNVWRNAGRTAGVLAFACDFGKGILVVLLAKCFGGPALAALSAAAVLVGHSWPVFLGFRGGKMVAAGVGVVVAVNLLIGAITAAVWLIVLFFTRYVSLASIIALAGVPLLMLLFHLEPPYILLGVFLAVFTAVKHISNIGRLLAGTEPKIKVGSK